VLFISVRQATTFKKA